MVRLQEISVKGCVDCQRFEDWWNKNKTNFPNVNFEKINNTDPEWQELVSKYTIMASPGIVINGELFSTGSVNTTKLEEKLSELAKKNE